MQRREFFGHLVGPAILARAALTSATAVAVIELDGCSAIDNLRKWIPVGLTSLASIVKLLGPIIPPQVQAVIVLIQAGFSALLAAINSFQAGATTIDTVINAITAIETSFASFFQQLSVPTNLLNLIEGLAGIILSTIAAFAAQISPAPTPTPQKFQLASKTIPYAPVMRSIGRYRSEWNALCLREGHREAEI